MTDNEIIKAMQCVIGNDANCSECTYQKVLPFPSCRRKCAKNALDLINRLKMKNKELDERNVIYRGTIEWQAKEINRQKAENERLEKNYEELIYKTECLLCHATGNKFSKHTYTTQEMISFVDDYIQDCCDEAVEETKATAKSEAIKEFAKRLIEKCYEDFRETDEMLSPYVTDDDIDDLVKEMTEVNEE